MKGLGIHGLPLGGNRAGRSPLAAIVALLVLAPIVAFFGGFAVFANHVGNLVPPDDPEVADAIIVLTGGSARVDTGVELLNAGKGRRLLISGVNPLARPEDLRRATGADEELFECCVDIDHAALDTIGNAEESARWVIEHAFESIILVTNNYHMPRSLMEMRRLLAEVDMRPYPVVHGRLDGGEWLRRPAVLRVLFTEYTKLIGAFARGLVHPVTLRAASAFG